MLLLLALPLGLLWLLIAAQQDRIGFGRLSIRGAFVLAYLAFQILLLAITELTSIGHHFTAGTVATAWLAVTVALLLTAQAPIRTGIRRMRWRGRMRNQVRYHLDHLTIEDRIWAGVVVVIIGILVVEGSLYPPAFTDSMVYHLARIEHWIQNRSVAPFAAHYLAQIELSPLSEYNLAHLHLLSGTDRFDWSMQLLAALVSIVGVSELARLLGSTRSGQIAAAVICVTIPSGILLATSTGNDYFAAGIGIVLLVVLAAFSFEGRWGYRAVALGAAVGLVYMAKGSLLPQLGPPALALFAVAAFRQVRLAGMDETLRATVKEGMVIGASALAMVLPFVYRTVQLFGSPFGPISKSTMSALLTVGGMGGNIVRSTAANFAIGNGVSGLDTYLSMAVLNTSRHVYALFGVSQNDPRFAVSAPKVDTFKVQDYSASYDRIGEIGANPWHVLLFTCSVVALAVVVLRGSKRLRVPLLLAVGLVCGFLLFSATVRWGPYNVRYTLVLLVAGSAVVAMALALFPDWVVRFVLIGLVVTCLPQLLDNLNQPLVPRQTYQGSYLTPYFAQYSGNPQFSPGSEASAYQTATSMLAQSTCRRAAIANWIYIEYPLWVGLQHDHWGGQLNDFGVDNQSRALRPHYVPCARMSEEGRKYVTPDNGTVNVQLNDLALSIDSGNAASIHTAIPSFSSTVAGARVLPGGAWVLTGLGSLPILKVHGSLYVFSDRVQRVQLQLHLPRNVPQPLVALSGSGGQELPTTMGRGVISADLDLARGIDRIDLTTSPSAATSRPFEVLTGVTLAAAGN